MHIIHFESGANRDTKVVGNAKLKPVSFYFDISYTIFNLYISRRFSKNRTGASYDTEIKKIIEINSQHKCLKVLALISLTDVL